MDFVKDALTVRQHRFFGLQGGHVEGDSKTLVSSKDADMPAGIALGSDGSYFFTDLGNQQIKRSPYSPPSPPHSVPTPVQKSIYRCTFPHHPHFPGGEAVATWRFD